MPTCRDSSRGVFGWSGSGGDVRFSLGAGADVRAFDALQFRMAVNPGYRANSGVAYQDLSLELVDGGGRSATVTADDVGNEALRFPSGVRRFTGHVLLQQQRFPLEMFDGLDLADVEEIVIRFDRTTAGVIDVADLVFSAGVRASDGRLPSRLDAISADRAGSFGVRCGQEYPERRTAAVTVLHPCPSTVQLGEPAHQRESDADAR